MEVIYRMDFKQDANYTTQHIYEFVYLIKSFQTKYWKRTQFQFDIFPAVIIFADGNILL